MRWINKAVAPIAIALLLLAYGIAQNIIASDIWERIQSDKPFRNWVVGGFVGFVLLFAVGYALWERRHRDEAEEPREHPNRMRQRLVDRVLEFAQAQFDGGLYALARNEFDLAERLLTVTEADRALAVVAEDYYRGHPGPLVILGQPGSGKTTLLYELATAICSNRDVGAVPVPFSLSHWAVRQGPLDEWLMSELRRSYGVGSALARAWVNQEVVLPFLDGLDEVPFAQREACVAKINEYQSKHPDLKFVVTCREGEYRELKKGIGVSSAIVARTLSRERVESFLNAHSGKLIGLQEALRAEPTMWELMDTPLMLWVAAFAFQQGGPALGGSLAREQLFDRYVDAMLKRGRGEGRAFGLAEAKHWLRQTAACLNRAGLYSFHLEDLSPNWLPADSKPAASLALRCAIGLLGGLFFGLGNGLFFGLVFGLVVGLFVWPDGGGGPIDSIQWSWKGGRNGLLGGLVVGLVLGLLGLLLGGLVVGLFFGLVIGLVVGLVVGLFVGLFNGLVDGVVPSQVERRSSVNNGLKRSASFALLIALPFAILLALGLWLLQDDSILRLVSLLAFMGLVLLPFQKGGAFCVCYLLLRTILAWGKYVPWRYERFLYFAVDQVLMIRQGGSFRFIHRMLQEHLAGQADPSLKTLDNSSAAASGI